VEAAVAVGRVVAVRVVFEPVLDAAHAARRNSALDAVVSLLSGQVVQEDVMDPTTGIRLLSKGVVLDRAGIEALTLVRLDALRLEDLDLEFRLWGLLDDYRAGMNQAALAAGEVASWHPAVTGRGSYLVSVDAANVGICELDSLLSLEARELDRLYQRHVAGGERPVMTSLQMARQCDGIAVESGWGDGSYPVYWGVDAYGAPVRLVVEFL
jgi:hypothetical protein